MNTFHLKKKSLKNVVHSSILFLLLNGSLFAQEIISKQKVSDIINANYHAKILKISLDNSAYKVKLLTDNGRVIHVYLDAYTGEFLKQSNSK